MEHRVKGGSLTDVAHLLQSDSLKPSWNQLKQTGQHLVVNSHVLL